MQQTTASIERLAQTKMAFFRDLIRAPVVSNTIEAKD